MPQARKILRRLRRIAERAPPPTYARGVRRIHLPIPEPFLPPSDNPQSDVPLLDLLPQAYEPQSLVDAAVGSYSDPSRLSARQLHAKRHMTHALLLTMQEPHETHTLENLETWAGWVDGYFFMGTLMSGQGAQRPVSPFRVVVAVKPATAAEEARGRKFVVEWCGHKRFQIRVSEAMLAGQPGWAFGKGAALAGMLRALAAVYLGAFGCVCDEDGVPAAERCFRRIPSTYGVSGQGYCWQVLVAKAVAEIRGWDHRLRGFADHRADGNGIDVAAWAREEEHWDALVGAGDQGWRDVVEERRYDTEGEYGLVLTEPRGVVKRKKGVGAGVRLSRELKTLLRESVAFRENGPRMTRRRRG